LDESFAAPDSISNLATAQDYCVFQVRKFDFDRYLTVIAAPKEIRMALFSLFAFNLEVAKTREVVSEPMLGRIRLQWWREAIEGIYQGNPRQHEVISALQETLNHHSLSRYLFDEMIDGREFDLEEREPKDIDELISYADTTSGKLFSLVGEVTGSNPDFAKLLGTSRALIGLMRSISFHKIQGRSYLPGIPVTDHHSQHAFSAYQNVLAKAAEILPDRSDMNDPVLNITRWMAQYDLNRLLKKTSEDFEKPAKFNAWRRYRIICACLTGR
tara:strand:+ start:39089 stop:39901 length:813 start_codon:yes stop_codon:yes gene_type:complete